MNKIIVTVVTTLAMTVTGAAFAQENMDDAQKKKQRQYREQQHRGMQAMPVVETVMRAIRHLDLDAEQKQAIKGIMGQLRADTRPVMMAAKENHEQLKELVKASAFDEEAVAAVAEKEGDLAAERLLLTSRALSEVYGVLTAEQRTELETMAASRKDRWAAKRQPKDGEG